MQVEATTVRPAAPSKTQVPPRRIRDTIIDRSFLFQPPGVHPATDTPAPSVGRGSDRSRRGPLLATRPGPRLTPRFPSCPFAAPTPFGSGESSSPELKAGFDNSIVHRATVKDFPGAPETPSKCDPPIRPRVRPKGPKGSGLVARKETRPLYRYTAHPWSVPGLSSRSHGSGPWSRSEGCSAPPGPEVLHIEPGAYGAAFEAAVGVAARNGIPATVRDRRTGIIETEPDTTPSLIEPWRIDGSSLGDRLDRTIALERRRARFEFLPPGAARDPTDDPTALRGPDVLAATPDTLAATDRTEWEGPLELRVLVFLEQAQSPGQRPNTWSYALVTQTKIILPDGNQLPQRFWTPVARDRDFERRLLEQVQRALAEQDER